MEKDDNVKSSVRATFKLDIIINTAKDEAIFDAYKNMSKEFQNAIAFKDYYYINRTYLDAKYGTVEEDDDDSVEESE